MEALKNSQWENSEKFDYMQKNSNPRMFEDYGICYCSVSPQSLGCFLDMTKRQTGIIIITWVPSQSVKTPTTVSLWILTFLRVLKIIILSFLT